MRRALPFVLLALVSARPGLPPLPKSVYSVYGPVPVIREHPVHCGNLDAIGCYDGLTRRLVVDDSLVPVMQWRVLEHEVVHLALRDANVQLHEGEEDGVANAIANRLVAEMAH